jgi:6-phospho-beta-glucosidase
MQLTVLGGASMSTPHLYAALASEVPAVDSVRLLGRRAERLKAVARACGVVAGNDGPTIDCVVEQSDGACLSGSDVVLVQFRVGGFAARADDESFPLAFGVVGDEGLGPSGLAAARRSWPVLRRWLDRIATQSPQATVVLLTSPAGLLVRLASLTHPSLRILHVCELPWRTLVDYAAACGVAPAAVSFSYYGVNHLGWFHRVDVGEESLLGAAARDVPHPLAKWVRVYGALPLPYSELLLSREVVLRRQSSAPGARARDLDALRAHAMQAFATGSAGEIRHQLAARPAPWYAAGVAPLLRALGGSPPIVPVFLTQQWADGSTDERAFCRDAAGLVECTDGVAPPEWLRRATSELLLFESLAAEAILEDSVERATDALVHHPFVPSARHARALAGHVWATPLIDRST